MPYDWGYYGRGWTGGARRGGEAGWTGWQEGGPGWQGRDFVDEDTDYDRDFGGYGAMRYGRWDEPGSRHGGAPESWRTAYGGVHGGGRYGPASSGGHYDSRGEEIGPGWGSFGPPTRGGVYSDGGDRGVYGGSYPGYGGHPGGRNEGEYYGGGRGREGGYWRAYHEGYAGDYRGGPSYGQGGGYGPGNDFYAPGYVGGGHAGGRPPQLRGYDRGWGGGGGGMVREPFLPEEAYRRHPELGEPPRRRHWEAHQHAVDVELDDGDVEAMVRERIAHDPWLDAASIEVSVEDGVVTLTGEVDDFLEARYAWDNAWEADGVHGVINNLTVRTDQPQPVRSIHGDAVPQSAGDRTDQATAEDTV